MNISEELAKKYQTYNQNQLNNDFIAACFNGNLNIVQYLLTSPELKIHANIHTDIDAGFRCACKEGYLDIVKYLLTSSELKEHADIHAEENYGLKWACGKGYLEIVQYLLTSRDLKEHADIHCENEHPFIFACVCHEINIILYLLSFNGEQCIDFQDTTYNLDWAIENQLDDVIIAMIKNLKKNTPFEYIECLPKVKVYNKEIYEQVKNIEVDNLEVNPQETVLFV